MTYYPLGPEWQPQWSLVRNMNTLLDHVPTQSRCAQLLDLAACDNSNAVFPLAPALCLRERETPNPRLFGVRRNDLVCRLRPGLFALVIALLISVLPITRSRADSVDALANLTGASTSTCQSVLTDITGGDPSTLLDGLLPAEAEELLELTAHLAGLTPGPGTETVGIATPSFRDMAEALEDGMPDHLYYGQIFLDIRYATTNRTPGEVVDIGPVAADSAIWSGHYLAAEAFRY